MSAALSGALLFKAVVTYSDRDYSEISIGGHVIAVPTRCLKTAIELASGAPPTPAETGGDVSPNPTANSGES